MVDIRLDEFIWFVPKYLNKLIFVNGINLYAIEVGNAILSTIVSKTEINDADKVPANDLNTIAIKNASIKKNTMSSIIVATYISNNTIGEVTKILDALKDTRTLFTVGMP